MIIGAIVLAAGKSERMGQNKLLLSLNGKKLIDNILDALAEASINEQVVVVGHKPEQIIEAIKPRMNRVKIALNRDYENGMISSFQTGLKLLKHVNATFLVLGDEPIFDPKVLRSLIAQMEKSRGETLIASPIHKGKKGHPLLFHSQLFPEILGLKSLQTIRDVVHSHENELVKINAPKWTVMDIDTPEDYSRVSDFIKTNQIY
jgi:molybdenum cofactor cytidylyltransferase